MNCLIACVIYIQANLTELEGQVVKLTSQLKLKEEEVTEINEVATKLTKERDQFADVVRQEFVDKYVPMISLSLILLCTTIS